jgi:hypothetical protein
MTIRTSLAAHRVQAFNTAVASENKIHDDTVAQQLGFAGGLVPGVDVYAYMTHLPVARWGRAWLDHGEAECRLLEPVYDGHVAVATATPSADALELAVESDGVVCATGRASMAAPSAPVTDRFEPVPPREIRPPASEESLAPQTLLGMRPFELTGEYHRNYVHDVRETHSLYLEEGICHPGLILRLCNWVLMQNVILGPWIHVGGTVRNLGLARVGDVLAVRAVVAANYERKGHRLVELDAVVFANDRTPLAQIAHTAIYRPRQLADHTI